MSNGSVPAIPSTPEIDLKSFLENAPPGTERKVRGLSAISSTGPSVFANPALLLHCSSDECSGLRTFRASSNMMNLAANDWRYGYLTYPCSNCRKLEKRYALGVHWTSDRLIKIGELPSFGPPIPARLISMIAPHREFFLKGRRAESQSLGVAAFAYYRRVVEAEKGRIINEIAKVARALGASSEILEDFDRASEETQFVNAIGRVKHAIPPAILINGHNPLTLLHSALSEGLHGESDEECLEYAQHIRVILIELAERLATVLKEDQELKAAVTKLLTKRAQRE